MRIYPQMKTILILLFGGVSIYSLAQGNAYIGAFSYGSGRGYLHQNVVSYLDLADKTDVFEIRGEFKHMKDGFVMVEVEEYSGGSWGVNTVAVTNYPNSNELVSGHNFYCAAIRKGIFNDDGGLKLQCYEFFDLYAYRAAKAERAQKFAEQAKQQARIEAQAAKEHAKQVALKSNQDAAAKGDSIGLLRMGERYRDGDGVEKDLAKAKDYLQRAAYAGSPTAAEELKIISQ
jgi:TPR repeat protein